MRYPPIQPLLERIQGIVARETGQRLGVEAILEVEAILQELEGGSHAAALGQEFLSREVTILLADLRGFTAIAAGHPAAIVIQLLNPCLIKMSEIIFRHHGTIDKFMGDSIMVLFGAPVSRNDDVTRALACAVEMQRAMSTLNLAHKDQGLPELYMGIGINTGEVLAGMLGSEHYSEYTVIGDEVNLASRIEAFSLRGQVLISQSTYEHCKDFVETNAPMDIYVKGKPEPVSLREVIAIPSLGLKVPRQEIRRSHRVEVKLPLTYQLIDNGIILPEIHAGIIRDIGYQGVLIETDRELPLYTEIKLDFDLPLVDYQVRDIYAKIVGRKPNDRPIQMGVEFTSVTAATNMKIQLFVQLLIFTDLS
ncbi:MAG: adenylate cyclase [Methylococcaceae bacterium]|nr:MAG: adenylate cyclase [Methylococcaceae bacterium]